MQIVDLKKNVNAGGWFAIWFCLYGRLGQVKAASVRPYAHCWIMPMLQSTVRGSNGLAQILFAALTKSNQNHFKMFSTKLPIEAPKDTQ